MIKGIPKEILDLCVIENPHAYDHPDDYKIVGIKPQTKPCEDCGNTVVDRRTSTRLSHYPSTHWRTICDNCKCYLNPNTGKFDIKGKEANLVFISYSRKTGK